MAKIKTIDLALVPSSSGFIIRLLVSASAATRLIALAYATKMIASKIR